MQSQINTHISNQRGKTRPRTSSKRKRTGPRAFPYTGAARLYLSATLERVLAHCALSARRSWRDPHAPERTRSCSGNGQDSASRMGEHPYGALRSAIVARLQLLPEKRETRICSALASVQTRAPARIYYKRTRGFSFFRSPRASSFSRAFILFGSRCMLHARSFIPF